MLMVMAVMMRKENVRLAVLVASFHAARGQGHAAGGAGELWDGLALWLGSERHLRFCLCSVLLATLVLCAVVRHVQRKPQDTGPSPGATVSPKVAVVGNGHIATGGPDPHSGPVHVYFGSQTGTAKRLAKLLAEELGCLGFTSSVSDLRSFDPEDSLLEEAAGGAVCVFVVSTYSGGAPPEPAAWFCKWLEEAASDFRYGKTHLRGVRYAVFGLGDSVYQEHYNTVGKNVDKWLWQLGARRVLPRGDGDFNVVLSRHGSADADFEAWKGHLVCRLRALADPGTAAGAGVGGQQRQRSDSEGSCRDEASEEFETTSEEEGGTADAADLVDVEDLGRIVTEARRSQAGGAGDVGVVASTRRRRVAAGKGRATSTEEPREMITPALREALTKQGYRLIGTHSGVKLCRWTKSMLRGRGGCYKHAFYGIESHRCMEATPSLACANKCIFCWRHHTNPVGTEWRWKMDPPELILQEALENHMAMIRQFKGVPGVRPERFQEGLVAQHCALSLVGEPIMYPEINRFLRLLHRRGLSSFVVTNAQFPDEIRTLEPVTQLYVSVDASTRESLRRIDRPLFKDFWTRFLDSLRALSEKGQRTVYRLTLVKAWNVEEVTAYANLVALGNPDFIEVKGVTYCGESSASSLTMANVPWHEEVVGFVRQLAAMLPDYELACEHEHSNCLLLAHKRFKRHGEWWTWINYTRFQELARAHAESGGAAPFTADDYAARTPRWALFGSRERGFDPADTRFFRKNRPKDISGC
ncbi:S-adenosyl-L-methionine-dependent tRNA 4-demethylwyosine synthase TYW1B isoform X1 [Petromyzon marinus]|uniref:S-adenosyl-L-methionine-dependent tRNA 4-demethylwyosine synthase TYW1B isoform X1 n=1 Tax=Petromyzon marinus TaxID=7757 RepID=UPI003F6E66DF